MQYYRHYLLGRQFLVRTDHQALKWLFSLKEPKQRISRWIETLSTFNFIIEYRPGVKHGNADAMSRCSDPQNCQCEDSDEVKLACGPCNKCSKKAQDMQSKYFPELQMKTGNIYRLTTPSILNKPSPSLMYDFLMVVFLWDVSSFSPKFSDWTEGNPGYFSNLFHPLIRKCAKVQTRSSTKGQKTRNKTEDRPAERRQHQNKQSTDDVPQQRKDPPDKVKQKVSDRSTWSSN